MNAQNTIAAWLPVIEYVVQPPAGGHFTTDAAWTAVYGTVQILHLNRAMFNDLAYNMAKWCLLPALHSLGEGVLLSVPDFFDMPRSGPMWQGVPEETRQELVRAFVQERVLTLSWLGISWRSDHPVLRLPFSEDFSQRFSRFVRVSFDLRGIVDWHERRQLQQAQALPWPGVVYFPPVVVTHATAAATTAISPQLHNVPHLRDAVVHLHVSIEAQELLPQVPAPPDDLHVVPEFVQPLALAGMDTLHLHTAEPVRHIRLSNIRRVVWPMHYQQRFVRRGSAARGCIG